MRDKVSHCMHTVAPLSLDAGLAGLVVLLTLAVVPAAWSAQPPSCTVSGITYDHCGADGGDGTNGAPNAPTIGAGGMGGTGNSNPDGSTSNGGNGAGFDDDRSRIEATPGSGPFPGSVGTTETGIDAWGRPGGSDSGGGGGTISGHAGGGGGGGGQPGHWHAAGGALASSLGGHGGKGGNGDFASGGGGGGGSGAWLDGSEQFFVPPEVTVAGGSGGGLRGGVGVGGYGGNGITLFGDGASVLNEGTLRGGAGGAIDANGSTVTNGHGGAGVLFVTSGRLVNAAGATIRGGNSIGPPADPDGFIPDYSRGGGSGISVAGTAAGLSQVVNAGSIQGGDVDNVLSGGNGGMGIKATYASINNSGTVAGGNGNSGHDWENPTFSDNPNGDGGDAIRGDALLITNTGSLTGGPAGTTAGTGGRNGAALYGSNVSLVNSGSLSGGGNTGSGDGVVAAVRFTDGSNRLELLPGYNVSGLVLAGAADDTLVLGGASNAGFDLGRIGASAQYRGFEQYAKSGTGTWTLTGNNLTAAWTIAEGTLQVDGSIGDVTVDGGVLTGTGSTGAITLADGGRIAPGNSPGTLSAASLDWNGGGSFDFQLGSTIAGSDLLALSGALSSSGGSGLTFHFSDGNGAPQLGTTYTLITFADAAGLSAANFSYDYNGNAANFTGYFLINPTSLEFVADLRAQSISFDNPGSQIVAQQVLSLNPVASSGLPVTLVSSTPAVCTVTDNGPFTVALASVGTCTLTASQQGNVEYAPAMPVIVSFQALAPLTVPAMNVGIMWLLGLLLGCSGLGWLPRRKRGQT